MTIKIKKKYFTTHLLMQDHKNDPDLCDRLTIYVTNDLYNKMQNKKLLSLQFIKC